MFDLISSYILFELRLEGCDVLRLNTKYGINASFKLVCTQKSRIKHVVLIVFIFTNICYNSDIKDFV